MNWISWIETIVGVVILFEGLYIAFWTERVRELLKELSDLSDDGLVIIGNVVAATGLALVLVGIYSIWSGR